MMYERVKIYFDNSLCPDDVTITIIRHFAPEAAFCRCS